MLITKFYRNVSMWGLVLNDLLQGIRWCNRILIWTLGLAVTIFFTSKSIVYMLMSAILDLLHVCVWLATWDVSLNGNVAQIQEKRPNFEKITMGQFI